MIQLRRMLMTAMILGLTSTVALSIEGTVRPGYFKLNVKQTEMLDFDGRTVGQYRTVLYIPPEYGKLITVTETPGLVLWFQDDDGRIRNVTLDTGDVNAADSFIIERHGKVSAAASSMGVR
jgi:hypothetical protein